ncbi:MAG: fatty acid desaturase family protein [Isosphaeraceae bacterium]
MAGLVDPKTLKTLSVLTPWRSVLQIALEWAGVAAAIALCEVRWNPLLYIAAVIWIGARQNALAVLMHDAAHYRLLPNRSWNEWLGEILTAWPLLLTVNSYRQTHFAHHRHVNTPRDPDWQRKQHALFACPKPAREIALISLQYLLGLHAFSDFWGINHEAEIPVRLQRLRLSCYAAVTVAGIVFHFWLGLLLYWMVPLCTYFLWLIYLRGVAEHFAGIEHNEELIRKTRHVDTNLIERLLIAPNHVAMHTAHHLYPSVPFYNLPRLQRVLMQHPEYAKRAHITKGYLGFLKECLHSPHPGSA